MKHVSYARPFRYHYLFIQVIALGCLLTLARCTDKVEVTRTYRYMKPVYMTTNELRSSFAIEPPQTLSTTGKIYYLAPYLLINKPGEGIHVIDNSDPANPVNLSFINIPGNYDMAAKGTTLYADSFIDLLALDISDLDHVQITKRVENVFPRYNSWATMIDGEDVVLTDWVEEEVVEVMEGDLDEFAPGLYRYQEGIVMNDWASFEKLSSFANTDRAAAGGSGQAEAGVGGSMARFAISGERLYTVDDSDLQVFDISQLDDPEGINKTNIAFSIETIFPYKDKLFIGSQIGMFIYDISNPDNPVQESEFTHMRSCDPVVANDSLAYVTLRDGSECWGGNNVLEVVDIENVNNPQLVATFQMEHPHGLGIDGTLLFICEGEFGLKIFDATDTQSISENLLANIDNIHAFDVIPLGGVLMVIGQDGLYQYDYSDPNNIELLSKMTLAAL
uniref:LVIVD repeat-containing protein n=1 Tax=Roseihalotalea indica TaxID=2867963 RepID=A0AA49JDN4_9BACT|nr:hypothetical protein K4G66_32025 [Tunicatimonas sp. TK19036]